MCIFSHMLMLCGASVCFLSRVLGPVAGQEGLAQVPLGLLDAELLGQSQGVTQRLMFKYSFEGLFEKSVL